MLNKLIWGCLLFGVTMTAPAQVFLGKVSLNPAENQDFGAVKFGYGAQVPHNVTVSYIGNQPIGALTVALSGKDANSFALSTNTINLVQKQITFGSSQKLGFGSNSDSDPLTNSFMIMTSAYTTDSRGKTVLVTYTMSTPGYLNVIDIETKSVVEYYMGPETGESFAWSVCKLASSNVVYVGITHGGSSGSGYIYKYDPVAKTFTKDATVPSGGPGTYMFSMVSYGTDLYFGSYNGGRVMKYNTLTKAFTELWQSGFSYVRGMDIYNGTKIYAGISTSTYDNCIYEINMSSGVKKNVPLPDNYKTTMNSGLTSSQINAANCEVQALAIRGDIAIISLSDKRSNTAKYWLLLYNVKTASWASLPTALPTSGGYQGFSPTPVLNGYTYVPYNGNVWKINTTTGAISNTDKQAGPFFRGSHIVPVAGKNPIIYTIQAYGRLQKMDLNVSNYNMDDDTQLTLKTDAQTIRSFAAGPDGRLYMGGYLSNIGAIYNPSNKVTTTLTNTEQTEGIGYYDGKMYLGCYAGATIRRVSASFDPTQTSIAAESSTFSVPGQDRPYVVVGGANNLYVGTIPPIGQNGGAISVSKGTGATQNIISAEQFSISTSELQSVAGIAPFNVDGNEWFYVGSNVSGGTNATSKGEQAVITLFDHNRNVIHRKTMAEMAAPAGITITEKPQSIGHLIYSPEDGLIYGVTIKSVFAINPKLNQIVRYKQISNAADPAWMPVPIQFGAKGLLYTGVGGNVTVFNPKNFAHYVVLSNTSTSMLALGNDEGVYHIKGTSVYRTGTEIKSADSGSVGMIVSDDSNFTVVPKTGLAVGTYTATVTVSDNSKINESFNLSFKVEPGSSIETPQANPLNAYVYDGLLYVSGLTVGETLRIYDVMGISLYEGIAASGEMNIPLKKQGMYIVQTKNNSIKIAY